MTNLSRDWARAVVDVPVPAAVDVHRIQGKGVLDGVYLSIAEGEAFALGPNGAGRAGTGAWSTVYCKVSSSRFGGGIEI